jgi:hypothetical protein
MDGNAVSNFIVRSVPTEIGIAPIKYYTARSERADGVASAEDPIKKTVFREKTVFF